MAERRLPQEPEILKSFAGVQTSNGADSGFRRVKKSRIVVLTQVPKFDALNRLTMSTMLLSVAVWSF
jgi:hypothetical protein